MAYGEPTERCAEAVLVASRVLVAVAARSLADHDEDVSLQQFRTLVILSEHPGLRPVELAQHLAITPSAATRLCDRLVRKRLITRSHQGPDRRSVVLGLSSAGRRLLDDVMARRRTDLCRIVDQLPAERQQALIEAFTDFAEAADVLMTVQPADLG